MQHFWKHYWDAPSGAPGSFFLKWANFRSVRFYHWWVKVRKKHCFIYLTHMYMISNWKEFTDRQSWFTNLSEYFLNVFGSNSIFQAWTLCVSAILLNLNSFALASIGLRSGSIEALQDQIEAKAKDQAQQYWANAKSSWSNPLKEDRVWSKKIKNIVR